MRFSSVVLSVITVGCAAGAAVDDFMNSMRRYPDGTVIPLLPANKYQMRYEINILFGEVSIRREQSLLVVLT